jgi:hypothetical protein
MNSSGPYVGGIQGLTWDVLLQLITLVIALAALVPQIFYWWRRWKQRVQLSIDFVNGSEETLILPDQPQRLSIRVVNKSGFAVVAHKMWISFPPGAMELLSVRSGTTDLPRSTTSENSLVILGSGRPPIRSTSFDIDLPQDFLRNDVGIVDLGVQSSKAKASIERTIPVTVQLLTTPSPRVPKFHKLEVGVNWFGSPGTRPTHPAGVPPQH